MIINKEKLIARLRDKTGLDTEQVEDQLNQLINHILRAAEQGESYEIEGFGVFTARNGVLEFSPAEILGTEINNKYAGMKPIELIGAFKEPKTGEMPVMTAKPDMDDEVWAFDKAQASVDEKEDIPEEEEQPEEIPASKIDDTSPSEEVEPDNDSEEYHKEPVLLEEEATSGDKTQVTDDSNKIVPEEHQKDPIGKMVTIAVSILLVGITGWLGYVFISGNNTMSSDRTLQNESSQQEQVPSQAVKEVQEENEQVDEGANEESSEPEELNQVINDEGSSSQTEKRAAYGLQGGLNKSINSWYTVVVHSLKDADLAEDRKEQLETAGYRVMISQVTVNGVEQYRVGVGQFPSIEEALEATGELPEPYKSNNFIKRFY